jgi:hypothetical protein
MHNCTDRQQRLIISFAGRKIVSRIFDESRPQQTIEFDFASSDISPSTPTGLDLLRRQEATWCRIDKNDCYQAIIVGNEFKIMIEF